MLFGEINWLEVLIRLPVLMFSFSLHEFAHSFTAYALGDVTQKTEGRLTLNPLKHIDWMGFLCLLIIGFGWAKPVSVAPRYFAREQKPSEDGETVILKKGMKSGMALSSIAGPASNFILAFVSILIYYPLFKTYYSGALGINVVTAGFNDILNGIGGSVPAVARFVTLMVYESIWLNIMLGVFNMLPIPPLDGSKVFSVFLPVKLYFRFINGTRVMTVIFLILIVTDIISKILGPIASFIYFSFHLLAEMFYYFLSSIF